MDSNTLNSFRKTLRKLEREISDQLKDQIECCGVSLAQCHAILEIGGTDQSSISDVAGFLNLDKSTLSRTIDNLVKLGLADRAIDPEDRRYMKISLTEQGKKVYNNINSQCDDYYTEIFKLIPEDKHDIVLKSFDLLVEAMIKLRQTQESKNITCCDIDAKK